MGLVREARYAQRRDPRLGREKQWKGACHCCVMDGKMAQGVSSGQQTVENCADDTGNEVEPDTSAGVEGGRQSEWSLLLGSMRRNQSSSRIRPTDQRKTGSTELASSAVIHLVTKKVKMADAGRSRSSRS